MAKRELQSRYGSKKSFGKKAWVIDENGELKLQSYNTHVAGFKNGQPYVKGLFSQTTTQHIKEFLKQGGVKAETTADIKKLIKEMR